MHFFHIAQPELAPASGSNAPTPRLESTCAVSDKVLTTFPFRYAVRATVPVVTTISLLMALADGRQAAPSLSALAFLPLGCWIVGVAGLWQSWPRVAGTTLVAPWAWSGAALTAVAVVEVGLLAGQGNVSPSSAGHLRFLAAACTFCPVVALLGAKRPQDRAWQFIVLTLWVVIVMPVGEALLNRPGAALVLHPGRLGFLLTLVGVGMANRLATRAWPAGLLWGLGQILLLAEHVNALPVQASGARAACSGLALLAGALLWPMYRRPVMAAGDALQRLWLDFRDAFGTVWSLRVLQRFNAAAQQQRHGLHLTWHGPALSSKDNESSAMAIPDAGDTIPRDLRMLLLRFVSSDWIDARAGGTTDHTS